MKKISKFLKLSVAILLVLTSCSKEPEIIPTNDHVVNENEISTEPIYVPEVEFPEVAEPEPEIVYTQRSFTTGLPCSDEDKIKRPIAVMYNNLKDALPQESISFADIVYECDAEGGITRLMAIIPDWKDLECIGSVRSSRDYFVDLSESHGAIYVHAGGSPTAYESIIYGDVDNVDGVNMNYLPKNTFYRDKERIRNNGYEHSMMTTGEKLSVAVDQLKYSLEYSNDFKQPYSFNTEFTSLNGTPSGSVTLKHSAYSTVRFDYSDETNTYFKYSYNSPHVDGNNNAQLSFTNIVVFLVDEKVVDDEGRLEIDFSKGGNGYYFSGGEYVDITWSRDPVTSSISLKREGEELLLNPGKSHITLFNKNYKNNISISN